ncbi:hypothetical protein GGR61_001919 [Xanthomonas arboricola]|nr:hypothetical protein [Xanthomonas sp. 3058]
MSSCSQRSRTRIHPSWQLSSPRTLGRLVIYRLILSNSMMTCSALTQQISQK